MKIESHDINYTRVHEFSYEKIDTFQEELNTLSFNQPVLEGSTYSKSEINLVQRIKFALIQKLLQVLNEKQNKPQIGENLCKEKNFYIQRDSERVGFSKTQEVKYESTHKESESLSMQIKGSIKTQDGQSVDINLDFRMQRSFYAKTTLKKSIFTDPLVLNLEGNLPKLRDKTFSFDIDCDGKSDQISVLDKKSGFLALDHNENGLIDDGSELFGVKSGNAFKDLSTYDKDGNNWIDENDEIFEGLRIWSDDKLLGLGEVGIGAIYLGAHSSPYFYKNAENETLGRLRQSSVVLFESGKSGAISQVDFVKHDSKSPLSEALTKLKV